MTTPISTATPARAIKPTPTATDSSYSSRYSSQTPPISASGSVPRMIATSCRLRKLKYSSNTMIASVSGPITVSRSFARTMYSYCPDQLIE